MNYACRKATLIRRDGLQWFMCDNSDLGGLKDDVGFEGNVCHLGYHDLGSHAAMHMQLSPAHFKPLRVASLSVEEIYMMRGNGSSLQART